MLFGKEKKRQKVNVLVKDTLAKIRALQRKKASIEQVHKLNEVLRNFLYKQYNFSSALTVQELLTEFNQQIDLPAEAKVEIPIALIKVYKKQFDSSESVTRHEYLDLLLQAKKAVLSVKD